MSWLRGAGRRVAGVLAVACAGILSLAPAGGQAADLPGIYGADDRAVLDSAEWPWVAIGRVNVANGGFCTGTLIAPRLVLTAAHCLYDQRRSEEHTSELQSLMRLSYAVFFLKKTISFFLFLF